VYAADFDKGREKMRRAQSGEEGEGENGRAVCDDNE